MPVYRNLMPLLAKSIAVLSIVEILLTSCGSGNPVNDKDAVLMGMADPGRLDSEIIKIKVYDKYYNVPANCLFSPLQSKKDKKGYYVQGGFLIRVSWPEMECRNSRNLAKFSGLNFKDRMQIRLEGYYPKNGKESFNRLLFIATHPGKFVAGSPKMNIEPTQKNGELLYRVNRHKSIPTQPDIVYTDGSSYYTFCGRSHKSNHEFDWKMCHHMMINENSQIYISFHSRNFQSRKDISLKVKRFIQGIAG